MSPRDSFWFLAGALVAVAVMVTVRSWLRERPAPAARPDEGVVTSPADRPGTHGIPSFAVPVAAALALVGVALGIYFLLGSPESIASAQDSQSSRASHATASSQTRMGQAAESAGSLDDVTNKLAARLAAQGGSDNDWKLLAQSYEYMGRTAEAEAAKAHITSTSPTVDAQGVAQHMTGDQMSTIAEALDKPPASSRPSEPPAVHPRGSAAVAGNFSSSADAAGSLEADGNRNATAEGNAEIAGSVEIAAKLARQATTGATLFIYAKQPDTPGPPLAVLRMRAEHWPVTFTLNDANAMVPGRNLSHAHEVQIEARISKSGDALPRSGDLVGSVTSVKPRGGHPVKISIDREIG